MDKRTFLLGGLGIFLAGVLLGAVGTGLYIKAAHPLMGRVDKMTASAIFMERLDQALALSAEQKSRITPIVEDTLVQLRRVKAPCLPEEEKVLSESQSRIAAVLEPDQAEKFKVLMERFAARRHGGHLPPLK